ncbi:unnamed protein product [Hymenolepis diminuta]|uniref:Secreted protein n=1 Tax=Hymenolepis diminuta TaxID=6216 RepID=A0A0R3SZQ5_HYMDI|nr:unnamed protein product [Hymenolepis diminuta]
MRGVVVVVVVGVGVVAVAEGCKAARVQLPVRELDFALSHEPLRTRPLTLYSLPPPMSYAHFLVFALQGAARAHSVAFMCGVWGGLKRRHPKERTPARGGKLAERGFDPRTSGLWAQHASTAPLCCGLGSRL